MIRPATGLAAVALISLASADTGLAQSPDAAAAPRAKPAQAGRLAHVLISRREHVRPSPWGPERVEDRTLYTVVPFNWQGLYIGLHGGGAWGRTRSENASPFGGYDAGASLSYTVSPAGGLVGGQIGFALQSANWVFGPEIDFGYLGLDSQTTVGDDLTAVKYSWYATFTGRFGFAWDHALFYLKGGGALAHIRNTATDLDGGAVDPTDFTEVARARFGWALGGGVEYALAPNMSAKVEYLYMDFGKVTSGNADGDSFSHRNAVHSVKLGVSYRFGGVPLFIRF
jgi:outer membrane immunogenic protein